MGLSECRKKCGMSQRELADASGVSIRTLQEYEQKRKNIKGAKIETLQSLSHALNCTINDIIGEVILEPVAPSIVAIEKRLDAYCRQFGKKIDIESYDRFRYGYLNPNGVAFIELINYMYVDKTDMLDIINKKINTPEKFMCVSRPRRFGKSIAEEMMEAYYNHLQDNHAIFDRLAISKYKSYKEHLNRYDVLRIDVQGAQERKGLLDAGLIHMERLILKEIKRQYPEYISNEDIEAGMGLKDAIYELFLVTGRKFVLLIDEWDSIFRNEPENEDAHRFYIDWLRNLFKDPKVQQAYALVYMTGIMPIKKYGTQSALNNFDEYSMLDQKELAPFTGLTEAEVLELCNEYGVDYEEMTRWYDGYVLGDGIHIYNPKAVTSAVMRGQFENFWSKTGTFFTIKNYLLTNFDGLKDTVTNLLGGQMVDVNPEYFQNDMSIVNSKDDILTSLIHLGYLAYDKQKKKAWIPNLEIAQEFNNAISMTDWSEVIKSLSLSDELLQATWEADCHKVARIVDEVHTENISLIKYNDENSLRC